jgi:hypothetical protein
MGRQLRRVNHSHSRWRAGSIPRGWRHARLPLRHVNSPGFFAHHPRRWHSLHPIGWRTWNSNSLHSRWWTLLGYPLHSRWWGWAADHSWASRVLFYNVPAAWRGWRSAANHLRWHAWLGSWPRWNHVLPCARKFMDWDWSGLALGHQGWHVWISWVNQLPVSVDSLRHRLKVRW